MCVYVCVSVCARAIILISKLKRTNYKNATCDDCATTHAVAPRGFQSGERLIERSGSARSLLRSVRLRRIVENTGGILESERLALEEA